MLRSRMARPFARSPNLMSVSPRYGASSGLESAAKNFLKSIPASANLLFLSSSTPERKSTEGWSGPDFLASVRQRVAAESFPLADAIQYICPRSHGFDTEKFRPFTNQASAAPSSPTV